MHQQQSKTNSRTTISETRRGPQAPTQVKTGFEGQEETLSSFQIKLDAAKLQGDEWVETTPEIINYLTQGKGMGKDRQGRDIPYLHYRDIKVCPTGMVEKCIKYVERSPSDDLHQRRAG